MSDTLDSDLIGRLLHPNQVSHADMGAMMEAADEIMRLQAEVAKWRHIAADAELEVVSTAKELELANRRIFDLEQAATDPEYAKKNPLGGPARLFDVMADRIRAGENYDEVLKDYGFNKRTEGI